MYQVSSNVQVLRDITNQSALPYKALASSSSLPLSYAVYFAYLKSLFSKIFFEIREEEEDGGPNPAVEVWVQEQAFLSSYGCRQSL